MVNLGQAIGYLDLDTSGLKKGFTSALNDLKELGDQSASMSDKFAGVGSAMTTMGSSLTKNVTAPLVGAGTAAVKFATDFDDGMKKVETIADTSVKPIKELGDEVLRLSSDVNVSTDGLSEALYQVISATGDTANAMDYLEISSKLAKGGFTDVTMAVDGATSVMNAYGLQGEEAFQKVADTMITTQNVGKTTVDDLAKSLYNVIPTAASLGVSFDEVSAGLAAITAQGTPTAVATTQMRQLFVELSKDGGQAAITFQEMSGQTFKQFIESGGSVAEALEYMDKAAQEQNKSLSDMFSSVEAGNAALQLTGVGGEKFAVALDAMGESAGATETAFNTMSESAGNQFAAVVNNLKNVATQFGTIILPYVLKFTEGMVGFMQKLLEMDESTKQIIVTVSAVVAAIGPVLLIGGKLATGISSIMSLVSSASTALATMGTTIGAIAGPIALVIAGLVALWAAWQTNFGGIRDYTAEIMSELQEIFTVVLEGIKLAWENDFGGIKTYVTAVFEFLQLLVQQVMDAISTVISVFLKLIKGDWQGAWEEISGFLERTWARIKEYVSLMVDTIKTIISQWLDILSTLWQAAWSAIKSFFETIWNAIKVFVSAAVDWVRTAITNALNAIKTTWETIWNAIKSFFETIWNAIKVFCSSILDTIKTLITNALNAIKSTWETIWNAIKSFFENIWNAIRTFISSILDTIKSLVTNALNAIKSTWESVWNDIKSFFENVWNNIKTFISSVLDAIKSTITTALDSIKSTVESIMNDVKSTWENIWNGIKTSVDTIWNAIETLVTNALDSIKSTIQGAGSSLSSAATTAFNFIETAFESVWDSITSWFSTAINTITSTISGIGTNLYDAGRNIFSSLWDGMKSMWTSISSWFDGVTSTITSWFDNIWDKITGAKDAVNESQTIDIKGSYAGGLDYVPYNGYIAELHEGERVLTAEQVRNGVSTGGGGDTYNFYSPVALTPVESAREMKRAKQELALGIT